MANILEYVLSLKDQTTKTLAVIGLNSDKALAKFSALEKQSHDVRDSLKVFGNSVGSLREKLSLLKNERDWIPRGEIKTIRAYNSEINKLTNEINKLETINGSKFKSWAKDAFDSLPDLAKNPIVAIGATVGASLKKSMDAGASKMQLQVMTDDNIGNRLYGDLTKFANYTVFGTEVYDQATSMLGNGFSDSEVMPMMKMLGDVSRGSADKLQGLTYAMGQVKGAGKLVGNDLLQLQNAGFYPLAEIAKKTGESVSDVKKRMSNGKVTYDEVRGALERMTGPGGKFYDMLKKIAETPYGKLQQLQGTLDTLMVSIGNVFMPIASVFMDIMATGLDVVGKGLGQFEALLTTVKTKLQEGNPWLWGLVVVLGALLTGLMLNKIWMERAIIWQKIKVAWDWLAASSSGGFAAAMAVLNAVILQNPVGWFILGIIALIAVVYAVIYLFDGWGNAWKHLVAAMKSGLSYLGAEIKLFCLYLADGFLSGFEKIERGWYKVKSLWDEKGAAEGLSRLDNESKLRSSQLAYQKGLGEAFKKISADEFSKVIGEDGLHYNGKYGVLKDKVKSKLKSFTGITAPTIPGVPTDPTKPTDDKSTDGAKTNEAIATGGTKNTTVNISIGNLVKDFKVTASGITQTNKEVMDNIIEAVSRAVNIGAALGA